MGIRESIVLGSICIEKHIHKVLQATASSNWKIKADQMMLVMPRICNGWIGGGSRVGARHSLILSLGRPSLTKSEPTMKCIASILFSSHTEQFTSPAIFLCPDPVGNQLMVHAYNNTPKIYHSVISLHQWVHIYKTHIDFVCTIIYAFISQSQKKVFLFHYVPGFRPFWQVTQHTWQMVDTVLN
jgi:hypothetical protein